MNNTGVIDQFLNVFTQYIDSGFGLVGGDVRWLSTTLIAIDMMLAGLFWAMAGDEDILARLIRKTLYVGFFAFLISNFNGLCKVIYESFLGLGLEASGSALSAQTLLQPGKLAQVGIDAGKPILAAAGSLMGYVSIVTNGVQIFVLLVSWIVVVIAFFVLAVQLFITLIEFKLTTLAGFVLIPFALFNKTAFLAEKVLGNVIASGVKILVLAVVVGIGSTLFSQFTQGFGSNQPTIEDALSIMLGALALFGLGIFGPSIATGLVSGAPQLGAGAAAGTAMAAGGVAVAAGAGTAAVLGMAGSGIGAAARGVRSLAGFSSPAAAANASSATPPAWATRRMQAGGTARKGASAALQVVRSSDGGGGSHSVPLDQDEPR